MDRRRLCPTTRDYCVSGFQESRLDTLRTRTSAAYRYLRLTTTSWLARLFWKIRMVDLDRDEYKIDIHHIFPQHWCEQREIPPRVYNSIVNKTAISYKANRMIGEKHHRSILLNFNHTKAWISLRANKIPYLDHTLLIQRSSGPTILTPSSRRERPRS